jgi:hypothetical protein
VPPAILLVEKRKLNFHLTRTLQPRVILAKFKHFRTLVCVYARIYESRSFVRTDVLQIELICGDQLSTYYLLAVSSDH